MSIQAFREVLDSYKFWRIRTERHHQTRNKRKKCLFDLPAHFVRSADLWLNLRFTVVSKQDHVTHYLPEHQQIIILAVEYGHKRPAHAG